MALDLGLPCDRSNGNRCPALTAAVIILNRQSQPYRKGAWQVYSSHMDVAVTELRAHLSDWLERARAGGEVVITDRGIPVARLVGLDSTGTLERLTTEGVIGRAATARRPTASERARPRPRRPVSDLVGDQRR